MLFKNPNRTITNLILEFFKDHMSYSYNSYYEYVGNIKKSKSKPKYYSDLNKSNLAY